jgi:hypothetical protein
MHKIGMSEREPHSFDTSGAGNVPEYKKYIVGGEKERPQRGRTRRAGRRQ